MSWPQSPPATDEQLALFDRHRPAYEAWRATDDGQRVYEAIRVRAMGLAATGATRISVNALMEQVRGALLLPCNNTYRAWISRDLIAECPALADLIETRQRASA